MVALTYGGTRVGDVEAKVATKNATKNAAKTTTAAPRASWFQRFLQALMESRMRQAEREIRLHTRPLPSVRYEQAELPFKPADTDTQRGGW